MANAWLAHVKSTMKSHKGMKFKDVLKHAKKTYKKSKSNSKSMSKSKSKSKSKKSRGNMRKRQRGGGSCQPTTAFQYAASV